jgi:hypothetical protein
MFLSLLFVIIVVSLIVIAYLVIKAPVGIEDEDGFLRIDKSLKIKKIKTLTNSSADKESKPAKDPRQFDSV